LAAFIPTENIKDYVAHSGLLVSMIIAIILILALYTLYSLGAFSLNGTSLSSSSTPGFTLNPQFIISILTLVIMIAGVYFMTRKPNA
jgi:phosphoglycerol transferase MdoB-like AlkP superfamily enzyme